MVSTSISSLIHTDDLPAPQQDPSSGVADSPAPPADQQRTTSVPLRDLVLRFQVPLGGVPDKGDAPTGQAKSAALMPNHSSALSNPVAAPASQASSTLPALVVSDYIKRFRTEFQPFPDTKTPPSASSPTTTSSSTPAAAPATTGRSKNSVKSLLNADDPPARLASITKSGLAAQLVPIAPKKRAPAKRKPTEQKTESSKRSKTDPNSAGNVTPSNDTTKPRASETEKKTSARPLSEGKKGAKSTKKSVESTTKEAQNVEPTPKAELTQLSTTEAAPASAPPELPSPSVIEPAKGRSKSTKAKDDTPQASKGKDDKTGDPKTNALDTATEKPSDAPPPIIALSIPLLDSANHKPGKSQVIVNVLKLIEDKYGWSAVHPKATSALEMMDDLIDEDDDDNENDDENETEVADEDKTANQGAKRRKENKELTEEQLVRQHESRMNRKVGKYDYEDPFIDDEELQMEEEIASTKEGFFVYWGPLVDDRNSTTKKGSAKTKK